MKKTILGLCALAVAIAIATPANATCGTPLTFGQSLQNCGGGYCYVITPGAVVPTGGAFWSLTTGNVAVSAGDDNGSYTVDNWCRAAGPGCYLVGDWGGAVLDGCIDGKTSNGKGIEVMVAAVSMESGGDGYFGAAAQSRDGGLGAELEFADIGSSITLVPIPKPSVVGTIRSAPNVQISIASPAAAALQGGFITNGVATFSDVVKSFRIYKQVLPRGSAAPTSRLRSSWLPAGAATTLGSPFSYTETDCASDKDVYLATAVVFDSGFETDSVSANSTRVQCGPTLAEPNPRFKLIDKKPSKGLSPRQ